MAISRKSIKILWANAAGRCAFPECLQKLYTSDVGDAAPHTIGEMAHICGERLGSNRHDPLQDEAERDAYENLILMCPTHHTLIDKPENEEIYSIEFLQTMKAEHENFVSGRLEQPKFADKNEVAAYLYTLMMENHEIFVNFGPHSNIARKNPESDAHGVWLSERLATIIPNNRRMLEVIEANAGVFDPDEYAVFARFRLHVRSYEMWVHDEITYEGVVQFPVELEALVSELALARA